MKQKSPAEIMRDMRLSPDFAHVLDDPGNSLKNTGFAREMEKLLNEKRLSTDIIAFRSGLSKRYLSQVTDGCTELPRDKAIAIAFAMELTLQETQNFLKNAGLEPLYIIDKKDAVIIHGLKNNLSIIEVNNVLFGLGEFILE